MFKTRLCRSCYSDKYDDWLERHHEAIYYLECDDCGAVASVLSVPQDEQPELDGLQYELARSDLLKIVRDLGKGGDK